MRSHCGEKNNSLVVHCLCSFLSFSKHEQMAPSLLRRFFMPSLTKPISSFCSERLKSLITTLEIENIAEMTPLQLVSDFATLLGTYGRTNNFAIIFEPTDSSGIVDPLLQLACLDASLAMKPVFSKFQTVVLTSGEDGTIQGDERLWQELTVCIRELSG